MIIIWGIRTSLRELAVLTFVCSRCGNPAAHRIVERIRKFTLFFIPLFPVGKRTYGVCTFCGLTVELDKAARDQVLAQAQQWAPVPSGQPGTGGAQPAAAPGVPSGQLPPPPPPPPPARY